jgi:hypothetical protein
VLDRQRLGKQRVETLQLLNALDRRLDKGWKNHPATRMWEGFPIALIEYGEAICSEWISRGYKDSVFEKLQEKRWHGAFIGNGTSDMPPWLGDEAFHRSHQSNLIRKNPEHYSPLFPGVPNDLDYIWPLPVRA